MEIKKIINFCKKSGNLGIYENEGKQWITDGYALYPLFNLPLFDEETICAAYDISAKKAGKMRITFNIKLPAIFDYRDDVEGETECKRGAPLFNGLVPITTTHGIEFIESKYLSPFTDADDNMIFIYERTTANGTTYFAVKDGLMLVGILMPYDCINEDFVKNIKTLYEQCEITLYNKQNNTDKEV